MLLNLLFLQDSASAADGTQSSDPAPQQTGGIESNTRREKARRQKDKVK